MYGTQQMHSSHMYTVVQAVNSSPPLAIPGPDTGCRTCGWVGYWQCCTERAWLLIATHA